METPDLKLKEKSTLIDLENDLHQIEKDLILLNERKNSLIENIKKSKNKIIMLETLAFQYEELVKSFENRKNELLKQSNF